MSNRSRKRAPTRPIYIESSDEENGGSSLGEPQGVPTGDAPVVSASPPILSSPTSKALSLKRKPSAPTHALSTTDAPMQVPKPPAEKVHPSSRHSPAPILACRPQLLAWYDKAKSLRRMPWRKDYDPDLTPEAQSQRAYEILTCEIMLQQTQIATVIPYYNKWMETFPTVHALAAADIEAVNQRWKGLGYYSRAARLLAAAKKVVHELDGQFPSDAATMEKHLPGVGRYTAGAVCSIVYNEQTPAVDGNVQRLFSRLLALHAPLKGNKKPLELIWNAAHKLVEGCLDAGALNQALIELGSTVCKPFNPACGGCPLQGGCAARQLSQSRCTSASDIEDICDICEPFPDSSSSVTRFPMKVEKKKAREAACAVNVLLWQDKETGQRWVVLVRRPETGLLAGLYEFPTLPVTATDRPALDAASSKLLSAYLTDDSYPIKPWASPSTAENSVDSGSVLHVFSHIRMTYHVRKIMLTASSEKPELRQPVDGEPSGILAGTADDGDIDQGDESDDRRPSKKKGKTVRAKYKSGKSKDSKCAESLPKVRWVQASLVEDENISTGALKIWKLAERTKQMR